MFRSARVEIPLSTRLGNRLFPAKRTLARTAGEPRTTPGRRLPDAPEPPSRRPRSSRCGAGSSTAGTPGWRLRRGRGRRGAGPVPVAAGCRGNPVRAGQRWPEGRPVAEGRAGLGGSRGRRGRPVECGGVVLGAEGGLDPGAGRAGRRGAVGPRRGGCRSSAEPATRAGSGGCGSPAWNSAARPGRGPGRAARWFGAERGFSPRGRRSRGGRWPRGRSPRRRRPRHRLRKRRVRDRRPGRRGPRWRRRWRRPPGSARTGRRR